MTKNDWYDAGDQIRKLVQDAVDSKDFTQLSNTIANVVNDTVNGLQSVLKETIPRGGAAQEQKKEENGGVYQYTNREAAERIKENIRMKRRQREAEAQASSAQSRDRSAPVKVRLRVPGEISGRVMKWTGYSFGAMFGLSFALLALVAVAEGLNILVPGGMLALLFGVTFAVGAKGSTRVRLANRFRRYCSVLGSRTYCLVEELAAAVGKNERFVQKDLKKMIERGFFKEGYLARKETLLITDGSTYRQYLTAQEEYERRAMGQETQGGAAGAGYAAEANRGTAAGYAAEASRGTAAGYAAEASRGTAAGYAAEASRGTAAGYAAEANRGTAAGYAAEANRGTAAGYAAGGGQPLPPECREIVEEGRRYIAHIQDCNRRLDGQEISAKLDRLELVITRIFREVEKEPEAASELKKMMSYYLPTTRKLLDAYCEMDAQPIAGQNIESTKKEIEDALDTINTAFENLLDSFFEEKAWDISSDISVLHTMLAQEGLTGTDFTQKQGGKMHE